MTIKESIDDIKMNLDKIYNIDDSNPVSDTLEGFSYSVRILVLNTIKDLIKE